MTRQAEFYIDIIKQRMEKGSEVERKAMQATLEKQASVQEEIWCTSLVRIQLALDELLVDEITEIFSLIKSRLDNQITKTISSLYARN